jgi:RHS repeat-associated protein
VTQITYPTSPSISFTYDALSRVSTMSDAVGTTTYDYTSFGALASEDGPWDSDTVSLSYGGAANCGCSQGNHLRTGLSLQQPNAPTWTVSYAYDNANRLETLTAPPGAFTYSYEAGALIQKLLMPNGSSITNTFDSVARMTSTVLENSGNTTLNSHTYSYNVGNQRTRQTRTDGSYVDYTYDNAGELKSAIGKESGGSSRAHEAFGYAYDPAGNLNYRTNNALIQTFSVDSLNQLTSGSRSGTLTVAGTVGTPGTNVTSVTVADNGNSPASATVYGDKTFARSGITVLNGNNTFVAVAQDAYGRSDTNSVTVNLPSTPSYTYDSNGNLTSDGLRSFTYDDENQLITVSVSGSWYSSFTYDGRNRLRIRKEYIWLSGGWTQTSETHYIYDGNLVIQERDGNNVPSVTYTRGVDLSGPISCTGSLEGAGGIGGLLARTDNTVLISQVGDPYAFYHGDANGNVTMLLSSYQKAVAQYLHDAYGNTIARSGTLADANVYRFSSKEFHSRSGLVYYGRRFYDPNLQRWLNRDPSLEKGGVNLYRFVSNDPVNRIDPLGLVEQAGGTGYRQILLANCDLKFQQGLTGCAIITGICYAGLTAKCIGLCGGPALFPENLVCLTGCIALYKNVCNATGGICVGVVTTAWLGCRAAAYLSQ